MDSKKNSAYANMDLENNANTNTQDEETACCCCPLPTCSIIIAWVLTIFAAVDLIGWFSALGKLDDTESASILRIVIGAEMAIDFLTLLFCVLFFYGVAKNKTRFVLPFLGFLLLDVVASVIMCIVAIALAVGMHQAANDDDLDHEEVAALTYLVSLLTWASVATGVSAALNAYFASVVARHYKALVNAKAQVRASSQTASYTRRF